MLRLVKVPAKVWMPEEEAELVEKMITTSVVSLRSFNFQASGKCFKGWTVVFEDKQAAGCDERHKTIAPGGI